MTPTDACNTPGCRTGFVAAAGSGGRAARTARSSAGASGGLGVTQAGRGPVMALASAGAAGSVMTTASERPGAAGSGGSTPARVGSNAAAVVSEPVDEASYLFDDSVIRTYNIVIASADLATIDAHPSYEESVPAGLELDGKSYGPFMVRYKGAGGSFKPPCSDGSGPKTGKCSLKLDFNDTDPSGRFFGLKKLNFHSMNADSSYLRDRLGYRMFREMGVPAPRAVHARVLLNGELEGLYIVVEQIDGVLTRSRFLEGGRGNLYKEIWPMYDSAMPYAEALVTNEKQPNVQRMLDFRAALQAGESAAERYYQRDYLLRYLAVDRVTINDDGAARFSCDETAPAGYDNHNFYWYEELQSGRMWLLPWDLDKSFLATTDVLLYPAWTSNAPCTCTEHPWYGSQRPTHCDPLFAQLQTPLDDYERAVDAFLAGPFQKPHVDALLEAWSKQIRELVAESSAKNGALTSAQWERGLSELRQIIEDARLNRGYKYD